MAIGGIGSGENPFMKIPANFSENAAGVSGENPNAGGIQKPNEANGINEVDKTDLNNGAAGSNAGSQNIIDRSQFTDENDIQEIDLDEFQDDM